jgi:DNA polymerase-1
VPKRVHDYKAVLRRLESAGINLAGVVDDTLLAAFLVDSSRADYSLAKIVARHLAVPLDPSPARTADLHRELGDLLEKEIDARELRHVYETIELPLAPILARMESVGIFIDTGVLGGLSSRMDTQLAVPVARIFRVRRQKPLHFRL